MDYSDIAKLNKLAHRGGKEPKGFGECLMIGSLVVAFIAIVGTPLITYFIWAHAFVITKLWAWFIVPVFHIEPLTLAQAWGLTIAVTAFTYVHRAWKGKDERETSAKVAEFVVLCLRPWISLGVGYICAHYFLHVI